MVTKRHDCTHQHSDVSECQPAFLVYYHCILCGNSWETEWSCPCDDECCCGATIEAFDYEAIAPCACDHLGGYE